MNVPPPPYGGPPGYAWSGQGSSRPLPLAAPGQRVGARLLDYVFVGIIGAVLTVGTLAVAMGATGSEGFGRADDAVYLFFFFFAWGLWLFLYEWLFLMLMGATPGKAAVGIMVLSADGRRLTQGEGLGRAALFALPQSLTCVGHLFVLIETMIGLANPARRTLHDKAAGTVVVRRR